MKSVSNMILLEILMKIAFNSAKIVILFMNCSISKVEKNDEEKRPDKPSFNLMRYYCANDRCVKYFHIQTHSNATRTAIIVCSLSVHC